MSLLGFAGFHLYNYSQLSADNVISAEMKDMNEEPLAVFGNDALELPWVDTIDNLDPENNGVVGDKKWTMKKVSMVGKFLPRPILSKYWGFLEG